MHTDHNTEALRLQVTQLADRSKRSSSPRGTRLYRASTHHRRIALLDASVQSAHTAKEAQGASTCAGVQCEMIEGAHNALTWGIKMGAGQCPLHRPWPCTLSTRNDVQRRGAQWSHREVHRAQMASSRAGGASAASCPPAKDTRTCAPARPGIRYQHTQRQRRWGSIHARQCTAPSAMLPTRSGLSADCSAMRLSAEAEARTPDRER